MVETTTKAKDNTFAQSVNLKLPKKPKHDSQKKVNALLATASNTSPHIDESECKNSSVASCRRPFTAWKDSDSISLGSAVAIVSENSENLKSRNAR